MPAAPPSERELERLRDGADAFLGAVNEEYYRHYAGLKDRLELEPIYDRHAELTRLETARAVGELVDGGRRLRELWRFTCEGYLGSITREHDERVAALEADLTATVDGEEIPFRMLRVAIANEPDRERRRRLEEARNAIGEEHLDGLRADAWRAVHAGASALGAGSYLALYRDRFGMELDRLAEECRALLEATEHAYEDAIDPLLRARVGVPLARAERWDVARLYRAPEWDAQFRGDAMLPALAGTLADLGIDLSAQRNVHLDVEQRPKKTPRAFCAPIEVPGRVMLVIQPMGGPDDWRALFHEAGHTEHFAHTSPDLSVEERHLGDYAVTEGWATLLEQLVSEPAWLVRRLDVGRPQEFARESGAMLLLIARRYAAKLLYELEFHAVDDPEGLRDRYVELLADATKIAPSPSDYVSDLDAGFYASSYLRSWALEAQLRDFLRERFGTAWFARREAGSLLRELWSLGQKPTAEELLEEVTGTTLTLDAVVERAAEALRG